jgi:organic radical activating enzyme
VCLSPKRKSAPLDEAYDHADELKVIIQCEEDLKWAEECASKLRNKRCLLFLQPEWSVAEEIMPLLVEYAKRNPQWSISIQSHKYMRIP